MQLSTGRQHRDDSSTRPASERSRKDSAKRNRRSSSKRKGESKSRNIAGTRDRRPPSKVRGKTAPAATSPKAVSSEGEVRLNRFIAMAGVCARRKADELIRTGQVRVNGEIVREMGMRVSPADVVEVSGKRLTPMAFEYILLNKPSNTITTNSDEAERRIVLDLIDDKAVQSSGVFPVGRLDRNTVGVLLITNDGELAHRLMHPSYEVEKLYRVKTRDAVLPHQLDQLKQGVEVEGTKMNLDEIAYLNPPNLNELGIRLHEGKNRQIRRMLEAIGHETTYLERVNYAGLTTAGVRRGKWRRLNSSEIRRLRRLVKLK